MMKNWYNCFRLLIFCPSETQEAFPLVCRFVIISSSGQNYADELFDFKELNFCVISVINRALIMSVNGCQVVGVFINGL